MSVACKHSMGRLVHHNGIPEKAIDARDHAPNSREHTGLTGLFQALAVNTALSLAAEDYGVQ
jgi:hypothetical protein